MQINDSFTFKILIFNEVHVILSQRGKYIEVQDRYIASRLCIMHFMWWDANNTASTGFKYFAIDMKINRALDNINHLLKGMAMR